MSIYPSKNEAILALEHNNTTSEIIINTLKPNKPLHFTDSTGEIWTFITRRQNRIYLLAKTKDMKRYKEICYKTNY